MHVKITASWLVVRSAINEKGEEPGNEVNNKVQNGGLIWKVFTFPTICDTQSIKKLHVSK